MNFGKGVLIALVATFLSLATGAQAAPAVDAAGVAKQFHEVDRSRFVYGQVSNGGNHFSFKISNGWRLDPLHLHVHFIFLDGEGKELGRVTRYGWCPASLGGHAKECDYQFDAAAGALWARAAKVTVFGERVAPQGGPTGEGMKSDVSITYSKQF